MHVVQVDGRVDSLCVAFGEELSTILDFISCIAITRIVPSPQKLLAQQRMGSRLFQLQPEKTSLRYNFIQRKAIAKALRSFRILFVGTEAFKYRTI